MLYNLLKRIIQAGSYNAADLQNKLDVYFALGRLTEEQYTELTASITAK